MGCHSSKIASKPESTPDLRSTLLAPSDSLVKSPKAAASPETAPETSTAGEVSSPIKEKTELAHANAAPLAEVDRSQIVENSQPAQSDVTAPEELVPAEVKPLSEPVVINADPYASASAPIIQDADVAPAVSDAAFPVADKTGEFQEPTSRVIKKPQGWEEEGILFPHEGVRFLMQELSDAVSSMDSAPAWKWENLSTWYQDYFYTVVHHHHDAEEKIYLPWIQARVSVPDKITADHPELMRAMDDLSTMLKKGASLPATQRAEHLTDVQKLLASFTEDMQQHLAEEEEIIPQLLREGGFTHEEEGPVVGQIIEGLGLDGNKKALPPMLHAYARWAGDEKAEAFVSNNLPLPIQFLYRNFWQHDFDYRHKGLLASLAEGVDTNLFASKWFC